MEIAVVIQSIAVISLMIIIGALLAKTFVFSEDTRSVFISLIVNVAMPCIILSSIFNVQMDENTFNTIIFVFFLSILINVMGIALGWLLAFVFYRNSTKKKEMALLSGLGNTGFIGIPLCAILLGPEGALYAAIFDAGVDFTIWTVGVFMLQKNNFFTVKTLKSMVNIPLIAIAVGLTASYFHFNPPLLLKSLVDQLAALAAPLAMFYIGILVMALHESKVKQANGSKVLLPIFVKLIILPGLVALLIGYLSLEMTIVKAVLIQSMMPTLTLASILFAKYSADEEIGAITTVLSTLFALITIPLMIYLMNSALLVGPQQ